MNATPLAGAVGSVTGVDCEFANAQLSLTRRHELMTAKRRSFDRDQLRIDSEPVNS